MARPTQHAQLAPVSALNQIEGNRVTDPSRGTLLVLGDSLMRRGIVISFYSLNGKECAVADFEDNNTRKRDFARDADLTLNTES